MVATEYTWWEDSDCPRTFHSRRRENGHGTSDRFLPTPMWEMTDARDGSKRFRVSHRSKTRAKACRSSARRISQCFWTVVVYKRDSFGGLYRERGAGRAGSLLVIPLLTSWNPPWFRAGAPVVCRFGVWPVSCVFAFVRVISRFGSTCMCVFCVALPAERPVTTLGLLDLQSGTCSPPSLKGSVRLRTTWRAL